jgi:hypothetical protein
VWLSERTAKQLTVDAVCAQLNPEDIEAEFWRVVKNGCPPTEVVCSIDLDTTSTGSGFPQVPIWTIGQGPLLLKGPLAHLIFPQVLIWTGVQAF